MIEILQQREVTWHKRHSLFFGFEGHEDSWGFGFDCSADGVVDLSKLTECARENYRKCLTGTVDRKVVAPVIQTFDVKHVQERVGRCHCGRKITLSRFTNTCACGRDYCMSGGELAPREQWGEETGEHHTDIARV